MRGIAVHSVDPALTADRITLVDVGVRGGIDPRWGRYQSLIDAYGFEPDPVECARLNEAAGASSVTRYLPHALGSKDGESAVLHICKKPGCSSLLQPNMSFCSQFAFGPHMEVVKSIPVTLNRMDTVLGDLQVRPDVIKVDTQGSELEILKGAGDLLSTTMLVELEVEFAEQYVGQPLFADIDAFMRGRGLSLVGIRRTYWRRALPAEWRISAHGGQLMHGDALYLNNAALNRLLERDAAAAQRALACLSAYRQDDLVLSLLASAPGRLSDLSAADRLRLAGVLTASGPPWYAGLVRSVLGDRTNRELRRMMDRLRPRDGTDWHDPDFY